MHLLPQVSLDFYCKILGFEMVQYSDFPQWGFSVYFVAQPNAIVQATSAETLQRLRDQKLTKDETWGLCMTTPGCVELTWNHGSEKEEGLIYNTGNGDATGTKDGEKAHQSLE